MNFVPFQIGKIIFQTPNNLLHLRFKQTIKISFHFNWSRFSIIWHVTNQKLNLKNNPRSVTATRFCENKKNLLMSKTSQPNISLKLLLMVNKVICVYYKDWKKCVGFFSFLCNIFNHVLYEIFAVSLWI